MKLKKKLTSAISMLLALSMTTSACGYKDENENNENSTLCPSPSQSASIKEDTNTAVSEPVQTESVKETGTIEEYIVYETLEPDITSQPIEETVVYETPEFDESSQPLEKPATYEVDNTVKYIENLSYEDRCSLINKMNVNTTLKDILYKMSEYLYSYDSQDTFIRLVNANKDDIPGLLVDFVRSTYNGIFTNIHSSGDKVVYPTDGIKIFDNRNGALDLPKRIYMLDDPSRFGGYSVYREDIAPHGGIIGSNIIITDRNDRIILTARSFYGDASYSVVKGKNLYVTSLLDYLNSIGLPFVHKDEYEYADLYELKFDISKLLGSFPASDKTYSTKDILVLEVPKSTGSWFISNKGNERRYYFLEKRGPYVFEENTYVCKSIFHETAYVTYETTGLYGLIYDDYDESIAIDCDKDSGHFDAVVPLDDFMKERGYEPFEDGVCNERDLALLYTELCDPYVTFEDIKSLVLKEKDKK